VAWDDVDTEVVNVEPPHLTPGRTAYDWVMYMLYTLPVCLFGLVGIPVVALVMPVGATGRLALVWIFAAVSCAGAAALGVVAVGMARAMRRERAAGYTTLFDPTKRSLWQLHPRTGEVVRPPATPQLP
jgi:hypothetical protein